MANPIINATTTRTNGILIEHDGSGTINKVTVTVRYDVVRNGNIDGTMTLIQEVYDDLSVGRKKQLQAYSDTLRDIILDN